MMIWKKGNIWIYWRLGNIIVIPTNAGWKSDGDNVMGAGLAKQASRELLELPAIYGVRCRKGDPYFFYKDQRMICVPSKPLNREAPWLSWKGNATREQVDSSLAWLRDNADEFDRLVYVPLIGCGNGGLDPTIIKPLMEQYLGNNDKFIGVEE